MNEKSNLLNKIFNNPLIIIFYLGIVLLQYFLSTLSNNFCFNTNIKDFSEIMLQILFALIGIILVYYGLLNKISINNLVDILLSMQKINEHSLLKVRKFFDNYANLYAKATSNLVSSTNKIYNIILFLCIIDLSVYMVCLGLSPYFQSIILFITVYVFEEILKITNEFHVSKNKNFEYIPNPNQLLNIAEPLPNIDFLDIELTKKLPLLLLKHGSYIRVLDKTDLIFYMDSLVNIDEEYETFIVISTALRFNTKNISLIYTSKHNQTESIDLSKAIYNYAEYNPSIIIGIHNSKNLSDMPNFTIEIPNYDNQSVVINYILDTISRNKYIIQSIMTNYSINFSNNTDSDYILLHR